MISSNAYCCNICSVVRESDSDFALSSVGNFLTLQDNAFFPSNGTVTKNPPPFFVSCFIEVVAEIEDEVFCIETFNVASPVNRRQILNSGHYTCLVKDGETL